MLKVALLGNGTMGRVHLDAWNRIPGAEFVGIAGTGRQISGAPLFPSLGQMLDQSEADVVDICLPTHLHHEAVKEAAAAGKAVICEAPLGRNAAETEDMMRICRDHQVRLFAGQLLCFAPEYADASRQVRGGAVGEPGVIRLSRKAPNVPGSRNWRQDESKSGGIFLDLGLQAFDWLARTFGGVERVMALRTGSGGMGEDAAYALVMLRMCNGAVAHVELSRMAAGYEEAFEIAGSKGMLLYESNQHQPVSKHVYGGIITERAAMVPYPATFADQTPVQRELEHFADCLANGTEPLVTCGEALEALRITEAVKRSAECGEPVEIAKGGAPQ